MGEAGEADYYKEHDIDDDPMGDVDLSDPAMYWTTRKGEVIHIHDLKDGHLVNIIKMLRRRAPFMRLAQELTTVCGPRPCGEFAQEAFDDFVREMSDRTDDEFLSDAVPQWGALLDEADDRGLEVS